MSERAEWMSVLACAATEELERHWSAFRYRPAFEWLKKPEYGAVLMQGKICGSGREYSLGQLTITRCSVQLADGRIGVAYTHGRAERHAFIAAMFDALLQNHDGAGVSASHVLAELRATRDERNRQQNAETRQTRVDFTVGERE